MQPVRHIATEGESARFTCEIVSNDPLEWYKNNKPLPPHVQIHGNSIVIPSVTMQDKGLYQCIGKTLNNKDVEGFATLNVAGKSYLIIVTVVYHIQGRMQNFENIIGISFNFSHFLITDIVVESFLN